MVFLHFMVIEVLHWSSGTQKLYHVGFSVDGFC